MMFGRKRTLGDPIDTGRLSAFDRIGVLRALYPEKHAAADQARLWRRVFTAHPELVESLAILGRLYTMSARAFDETGTERPEPVDPYRLAREQGRRDLALEILAHNLSIDELNQLMEASYEL